MCIFTTNQHNKLASLLCFLRSIPVCPSSIPNSAFSVDLLALLTWQSAGPFHTHFYTELGGVVVWGRLVLWLLSNYAILCLCVCLCISYSIITYPTVTVALFPGFVIDHEERHNTASVPSPSPSERVALNAGKRNNVLTKVIKLRNKLRNCQTLLMGCKAPVPILFWRIACVQLVLGMTWDKWVPFPDRGRTLAVCVVVLYSSMSLSILLFALRLHVCRTV